MHALWILTAGVGFVVLLWACALNPAGARRPPEPIKVKPITKGPYRFLRHPMYVGTWLLVTGCAGLAAGVWNAVAVGIVAELLLREWAMRES